MRTSPTGAFAFPSSFGVLDRPDASPARDHPEHGQPRRLERPGAVGRPTRAPAVTSAPSAPPTPSSRTPAPARTATSSRSSAPGSPQFAEAQASAAAAAGTAARNQAQTDFVGFAVHCAQGSARCAAGQDDLLPGRARRLHRLQGPVRRAGDRSAADRPAGERAADRAARQPDRRSVRPARLPGLRRHVGRGLARLRRVDAGAGRPGHLRVHLRRARLPRRRRQRAHAPTARARPATCSSSRRTTTRSRRSSRGWRRTASTRATRCSSFTVDEGDHFVGGTPTPVDCDGVNVPCDWTEPGRRDQRQHRHAGAAPVPDAVRQFLGVDRRRTPSPSTATTRRRSTWRRRAPGRSARPTPTRDVRAGDRRPDRGQSVHRRDRQRCWSRWPTRPR